jgi:hypothetical protein
MGTSENPCPTLKNQVVDSIFIKKNDSIKK